MRVVEVSDGGFQPASTALVGAPGEHLWRVVGMAAGSARIAFVYSRPWETGAPAQRHIVTVVVSAKP